MRQATATHLDRGDGNRLVNNAAFGTLDFVDPLHGWGARGWLDPGRTDLNIALQLYATDDGGADWRLLTPGERPLRRQRHEHRPRGRPAGANGRLIVFYCNRTTMSAAIRRR